jgi:feruloyl esterase
MYLALEQWVEKGTAPSTVIATKEAASGSAGGVKVTRPLCAYPQVAKYKGSGDTNDAANFACGAP